MTSPGSRSQSTSGEGDEGCSALLHCPVCTAMVLIGMSRSATCDDCGVVLRLSDGRLLADPDETRAAFFAAADACSGTWTLRTVLSDPELTDPEVIAAYERFALAETGLVSLARITR
jgi:hypothetical protein